MHSFQWFNCSETH